MLEHLLQNARELGWIRLLSIPLVSALIGYVTNWLAVRMIFRPYRPIRLPGWTLQGLVPKRQNELAASIGHTINEHLISHSDVMAILNRPDLHATLEKTIRHRVAEFLDTKLKTLHPMVGMFLSGAVKSKLEAILVDEVMVLLPQLSDQMLTRLEAEMDFRAIVEEKVRQFDLQRLENIILVIAGRELKAIEWLGGALGFLIGLIQLVLVLV